MFIDQLSHLLSQVPHHVDALDVLRDVRNPWPDGPKLDFGPKGNALLLNVLGVFWGVCLVAALAFLLKAGLAYGRTSSSNPHQHAEAKKAMQRSAIGVVIVLSFGAIVATLLFLFGS